MREWISVQEALPKDDLPVLICDCTIEAEVPEIGKYTSNQWWEYSNPGWPIDKVTHWMPLPEVPNQDTDVYSYE